MRETKDSKKLLNSHGSAKDQTLKSLAQSFSQDLGLDRSTLETWFMHSKEFKIKLQTLSSQDLPQGRPTMKKEA